MFLRQRAWWSPSLAWSASPKRLWNLSMTVAPSLLSPQACTDCPSHPQSSLDLSSLEGLWGRVLLGLSWLLCGYFHHRKQPQDRAFQKAYWRLTARTYLTQELEHSLKDKGTLLSTGKMWPGSSVLFQCWSLGLPCHLASWALYLMNVFFWVGIVMYYCCC